MGGRVVELHQDLKLIWLPFPGAKLVSIDGKKLLPLNQASFLGWRTNQGSRNRPVAIDQMQDDTKCQAITGRFVQPPSALRRRVFLALYVQHAFASFASVEDCWARPSDGAPSRPCVTTLFVGSGPDLSCALTIG